MKQLDTRLMHPADQLVLIISRIYNSGYTTTDAEVEDLRVAFNVGK